MPTDDEFRRVAEDVRALAKSLARDIRAAVERARADGNDHRAPGDGLAAAGRAAREELRRAQMAVRQSGRPRRPDRSSGPSGDEWWTSGSQPRWNNWGRPRHRGWQPTTPSSIAVDTDSGEGARAADVFGAHPRMHERHGRRTVAGAEPAAPPLRHRHDSSTLVGLLILVFGLAWLVAGTNLAHIPLESVLAVALIVLGATTVVTARTDWALSRRAWPTVAGAGLVLALIVSAASPNLPAGFQHLRVGSRTFRPTTWSALPRAVHGGIGGTVVDLGGLPGPPPEATTLAVDSAAGRLDFRLPDGVRVIVNVRVAAGQITVNGVTTGGLRRVDNETLNAAASGPPLTLDIDAGVGAVVITRLLNALDPPPTPPALPGLRR